MEKAERIKLGKKTRVQGKAFEKAVERELESSGWIVVKWGKQVNLELNKLENCKPKFNPFTHSVMMMSGGFPDFLAFSVEHTIDNISIGQIRLIESKMAGKLDKVEKEKIEWIKNNLKIDCFVASKDGRNIKYEQC